MDLDRCCICKNRINIKEYFVPNICLIKNGNRAHRICSDCWWNENTGFARENAPHHCPGCTT